MNVLLHQFRESDIEHAVNSNFVFFFVDDFAFQHFTVVVGINFRSFFAFLDRVARSLDGIARSAPTF